jgi:hypothetical protein
MSSEYEEALLEEIDSLEEELAVLRNMVSQETQEHTELFALAGAKMLDALGLPKILTRDTLDATVEAVVTIHGRASEAIAAKHKNAMLLASNQNLQSCVTADKLTTYTFRATDGDYNRWKDSKDFTKGNSWSTNDHQNTYTMLYAGMPELINKLSGAIRAVCAYATHDNTQDARKLLHSLETKFEIPHGII